MWNIFNEITLVIDITTYCNAKCPQCARTDTNGLGKREKLPLINWWFNCKITNNIV
jgi:MoaA/NifB/PqqE/SkfB family radical SAM enzyme